MNLPVIMISMKNLEEPSIQKILCLHHNDADGYASAAIVRRALGKHVQFYQINYGEPIPWDLIKQSEQVIVVDFSLPGDVMQRLAREYRLIWIDHHISALKEFEGIADSWDGIRDVSEAGCVLTWQYFFGTAPTPHAIVLIGDRDIWRWAEPDTGPFNEWLFYQDISPTRDEIWDPLLDGDPAFLGTAIEEGLILRETQLIKVRRQADRYGFRVLFEGAETLAINVRGTGDFGAYIRELGFDIGYCYVDKVVDGDLMTLVTLYSVSVDVSKIAKKYGGGGHAGAAGFSFKRSEYPFPDLNYVNFDNF